MSQLVTVVEGNCADEGMVGQIRDAPVNRTVFVFCVVLLLLQ